MRLSPPNPPAREPLRQIPLALLLEMSTPAGLRKPKKGSDAAAMAPARTHLGRGGRRHPLPLAVVAARRCLPLLYAWNMVIPEPLPQLL